MPSSGSITSLSASVTSSYFSGASVAVMDTILRARGRGGPGGEPGLGRDIVGHRFEEAVVALVLEAIGEFGTALLHDATGNHHVHEVGCDVAEDAGVVRDQEHAQVGLGLGAVHALRHDL